MILLFYHRILRTQKELSGFVRCVRIFIIIPCGDAGRAARSDFAQQNCDSLIKDNENSYEFKKKDAP